MTCKSVKAAKSASSPFQFSFPICEVLITGLFLWKKSKRLLRSGCCTRNSFLISSVQEMSVPDVCVR